MELILSSPIQEELLVSPSELLMHIVEVAWHPVSSITVLVNGKGNSPKS